MGGARWTALASFLFLVALIPTSSPTPLLHQEADTSAKSYSDFNLWLTENQLPPHNLSASVFPGPLRGSSYRGLKTTSNVTRGGLMLRIPSHLFLSRISARKSKIGPNLRRIERIVPPKILLSLHLLYECFSNDASFWASFCAVLPRSLNSLLYFSSAELEEFQCSPDTCLFLSSVQKRRQELRSIYEKLKPILQHLFLGDSFSWNNFCWAFATVEARSFSINVTSIYGFGLLDRGVSDVAASGGVTPILVPFGDLINHQNTVPALQFTYEFNDTAKELVIFADRNYTAGEQVYISYGIMTNPDLLSTYGFVMPDNIYETVGLKLGLEPSSPHYALKHQMLQEHGLLNFTSTNIGLDGSPGAQFIEALRVKHFSPLSRPNSSLSIDVSRPIDALNEISVYKELLAAGENLLNKYPTTLWEDLVLLGISKNGQQVSTRSPLRPDLSWKARLAIMSRVEVKRILHAVVLHALMGLRFAHGLLAAELKSTSDEADGDGQATILQHMWKRYNTGTVLWESTWEGWRAGIDGIWDSFWKDTLPAHLFQSLHVRKSPGLTLQQFRVTKYFQAASLATHTCVKAKQNEGNCGSENEDGIRVQDFLKLQQMFGKRLG